MKIDQDNFAQLVTLNIELVKSKVSDYKLEQFDELLASLLERLPELVRSERFIEEMRRFLPTDVYDRTLALDKFQIYLKNTLVALFKNVQNELSGQKVTTEFKM